jgi:hypothetical protein
MDISSSNLYSKIIYKPISRINIENITEPLMIIDKGAIYPTIPKTMLRDYTATPIFLID